MEKFVGSRAMKVGRMARTDVMDEHTKRLETLTEKLKMSFGAFKSLSESYEAKVLFDLKECRTQMDSIRGIVRRRGESILLETGQALMHYCGWFSKSCDQFIKQQEKIEFKIRCCSAKAKFLKNNVSNLRSKALQMKYSFQEDSEKILRCFNALVSNIESSHSQGEANYELLDFFEQAQSMNLQEFDLPLSQAITTFQNCRFELSKIKKEAFQKIDECSIFFSTMNSSTFQTQCDARTIVQTDDDAEVFSKYSFRFEVDAFSDFKATTDGNFRTKKQKTSYWNYLEEEYMRKCFEYQQEIWNLKAEKELLYDPCSTSGRFNFKFNLEQRDLFCKTTEAFETESPNSLRDSSPE
eukprot:758753-Hanusia_phi.AAC.4